MILRTPPRKRKPESVADPGSAVSNLPLVVYEDPVPASSYEPSDQMLCTYQCRQMVKSEFLDAFDNTEKQMHEYKSRLEAASTDLSKAEAEKKRFKDQLSVLEQELAAAKGREQALQEQLVKEFTDSQERYGALLSRFSEIEVKHKKESEARKNAENLVASVQEKALLAEEKLVQLSGSSERERRQLQRELSHLKSEYELTISRRNADLERTEYRARNAEKESELLKKQLEELKVQLDESILQRNKAEQKLLTLTVPSIEAASSENDCLVKHLQEELRNYEAEVREARKLKSSHVNVELLKEKLVEEKRRREKAEEELLKLEEILQNAKKLEDELMSWKFLLQEIPDISHREDIPKKLGVMQKEVIDNMMKVGELNAHLKELEVVALESANLSKQQAETENVLARGRENKLTLEIKRLESMLSSVAEERDRLRKEVLSLKTQKGGEICTESIDNSIHKDIDSVLAERESTIRELENSLHEQRETINSQSHEIKLLNEKLNIEARKIKSLEREADRLRAEISLLESKLGHGEFSSANTKVLRMANTLAVDDEAKQTIEALQTELQKAQAKLQALEDLKGQHDTGTSIDSHLSEKLAQLKGQIATLEKREERYKTVFAEKISIFRRACCSLFGYKIVMDDHQRPNGIPVTQFTLQSLYAQTDDEKLEFEYESGNTNILVNDYTSQPEISQQVEIFIRKMNSIPAFTANLTIETFNRRTLS